MLDTRSPVEVNVLLNLALAFAWGWFVEWHFNRLIPISHHNGAECTVLSVYLWVGGVGG